MAKILPLANIPNHSWHEFTEVAGTHHVLLLRNDAEQRDMRIRGDDGEFYSVKRVIEGNGGTET